MSGVSFYLSLVFLLLLFFGKLRFHLNAARQKSLSAFLPKKLADAFYDTFIRFRLSVDVAGFVSSLLLLLMLLMGSVLFWVLLAGSGSRSGSGFGFLSVA